VNSYTNYPFSEPRAVDADERSKIRSPFTAIDLEVAAIVDSVQMHKCHPSCYKYGDGTCRYKYPKDKVPKSNFDKGFVELERDDEWVNNYSPWVLDALRCNMDIQFISSGKAGKALIFYITNYMTKSQLKVCFIFLFCRILHFSVDPQSLYSHGGWRQEDS